jgi:hypothetical protein
VKGDVRKALMGYSKKLFEDAWRETPESLKLKTGERLSTFPANLPETYQRKL